MIIKVKTLGVIEVGDLFVYVDGKKLPLMIDQKAWSGILEVENRYSEVLFVLELDGLIIDEYNLTVEQNIKELLEYDPKDSLSFIYAVPMASSEHNIKPHLIRKQLKKIRELQQEVAKEQKKLEKFVNINWYM